MFEPSGQELINIANESILNENEKIKSKYTVIIAAAKRARQLVDEKDARIEEGANPLTIAIDEIKNKEVKIEPED
ncbi:MAG: DNA-directed RNA polymerase subunit omega [Lachnospiraceae bacterium]|jgi:DNA-directed RNA polymerase subunit omega|nr:DNA-directed RNA polymerase subunit omega [Lachnospiraceae bacterium]